MASRDLGSGDGASRRKGERRCWPVGLGRMHGAERGHGTARECGERGAEGAITGKKKERRKETLTSGPHSSDRERERAAVAESWAARLRGEVGRMGRGSWAAGWCSGPAEEKFRRPGWSARLG